MVMNDLHEPFSWGYKIGIEDGDELSVATRKPSYLPLRSGPINTV
jgi:hypothetical protein